MKFAFRSEVLTSKYGNKPHLFSRHDATTYIIQTMLIEKIFWLASYSRLLWTIWYAYEDLICRAELCLCRFEFAINCCGWLHISFISGLFFDSDCFFDHTRLCVTSAWFYTRQKCSLLVFDASSKISTANWNSYPLGDETCPGKWHQQCVVFSRPYVDIFSTNVGRTAVLG